jgi:hypothetical protein
MNTKVKSYSEMENPSEVRFTTDQLENGEEIDAMIQEAQKQLLPCTHCGHPHPVIQYYFYQCFPPGLHYPHRMTVVCSKKEEEEPVGHCGCRSSGGYADDDGAELFRETLQLIVDSWNRRPE